MTLKSWTVSQTDTWKRLGKTFITHCVFSPMIFIVSAAWYLLVMLVLLPWLALDWLPKRRAPSRSTSPSPQPRRLAIPVRKLPIPVRDGSDIFAIMDDGSRIPVTPLAASTHAKAWLEVVSGAMVYEKTKLHSET